MYYVIKVVTVFAALTVYYLIIFTVFFLWRAYRFRQSTNQSENKSQQEQELDIGLQRSHNEDGRSDN